MEEITAAVEAFLDSWDNSSEQNRQVFVRLKNQLFDLAGIKLEFHPRPGLTYSLRASYPRHDRPLFVMIDVIDDQPRWLSVCFFGDMIQDPEERGAFVPGGLLGQDALCFDLDTDAEEAIRYVEARIEEAYQAASAG
jgi:hypothetical protein